MAISHCFPCLWELERQWLYLIVLRVCGSQEDNGYISLVSMLVGALEDNGFISLLLMLMGARKTVASFHCFHFCWS